MSLMTPLVSGAEEEAGVGLALGNTKTMLDVHKATPKAAKLHHGGEEADGQAVAAWLSRRRRRSKREEGADGVPAWPAERRVQPQRHVHRQLLLALAIPASLRDRSKQSGAAKRKASAAGRPQALSPRGKPWRGG